LILQFFLFTAEKTRTKTKKNITSFSC